ncbi:hypothetical protein C8F04DRAFT_111869 [Mycena alexandri]|uniref:DUF7730 domain-containing protein n=1 Tax=Mycena alexandri TaxID=1745969 RepID=A0AAD6TAB9_9AGAR|nr:hypothetical protein C8F04DRAFT_111869 [Mycena alexandri]
MSRASTMIIKGVGTVVECLVVVLCCPCLVVLLCVGGGDRCRTNRRRKHYPRTDRDPPPAHPPNPPPFPTQRIDIHRFPAADQSQSPLFKLPLELRELIYEKVLAGRLVRLQLVTSKLHEHSVVKRTCYTPTDDLEETPDRRIFLAEPIFPALLRSCRAVYNEAIPILHQRNTFQFWASQLNGVVGSVLGKYCLPNIRSVNLQYDYTPPFDMFALLHQMRIDHLAFRLQGLPLEGGDCAALDSAWGRGLLGLRKLRRFELWIDHRGDEKELGKKFRQLMIGPLAEENYRAFLES